MPGGLRWPDRLKPGQVVEVINLVDGEDLYYPLSIQVFTVA